MTPQNIPELLGIYEQLEQLSTPNFANDMDLVSVTEGLATKDPKTESNAHEKTNSAVPHGSSTFPVASPEPNPKPILLAPAVANGKPTQRIDIHRYCHPGAPEDANMFTYLWAIRGYHGKTSVWQNPTRQSQEFVSRINVHAMMMETREMGGYDMLDRNPSLWNELAFRLGLLGSRDQDDERAKDAINVVQRVNKEWLRPFEEYCKDWPTVPPSDKDTLIATLVIAISKSQTSPSANCSGYWPECSVQCPLASRLVGSHYAWHGVICRFSIAWLQGAWNPDGSSNLFLHDEALVLVLGSESTRKGTSPTSTTS
ncbi:hypothetical protein RhiLY_02702 [Ceratobasidium sp. AG-Ba]|nr:hypothetical protein RhiLY_02702 [Ceratobasidium sp. AG-Ba]